MKILSPLKSKTGQVNNLAPAIMALIFAAVVLVFGLIVTQELRDTTTGDISWSVGNESISAWAGTTNQSLDGKVACGFGIVSTTSVVVYNSTAGIIIAAGNYTAYPDGNIINLTYSEFNEHAWLVTYDYTSGGVACTSANQTVVGLGTFADFWEIIVLAIVITVVIGLLLAVFGGRRAR